MILPPWAEGPFELIFHGELHYRSGKDFDRRMALISFDNAIEVSIATYLSLDPVLRNGRSYPREDVERWNINFHTKLDFWETECNARKITVKIERTHFVWYHGLRNEQYHRGRPESPYWSHLQGLREAALWVFSILFDVSDVEKVLEEWIAASDVPFDKPERRADYDNAIDSAYGLIEFADTLHLASDLLYGVDPVAYRDRALELLSNDPVQLKAVS